MKYNNALEAYGRKHKLYIVNELRHNQGDYYDATFDSGIVLNYIKVYQYKGTKKEKLILRLTERGIIHDDELLPKIKEIIREATINNIGI